jgi:glycine hydroxymethyltransferase
MNLAARTWVPSSCEAYVQKLAGETADASGADVLATVQRLTRENAAIYELQSINLNPAGNVMNPRAEAFLAAGLGSRPSLGYPGDKYEMGLEAVEQIEVIAAELAAQVFAARYAEIRVSSGAMANLYAFMATTKPGDTIIVPPASIGGHVTHHQAGAAGLFGLQIHAARADAANFTFDVEALRQQARALRPALITIGGSMNLYPHPVAAIKEIAAEVGARLLFDAAHVCGLIAGGVWDNPLAQGADLMTMSTYKSLGGPAGGLVLTNDAALAERIDRIAFPGLTANFDVGKSAALAVALLDWQNHGKAYARAMQELALALALGLQKRGIAVHGRAEAPTATHQFALEAAPYGGGQAASKHLRKANLLVSGIGLPLADVTGDMNGIRFGTPEVVRWGMTSAHAPALADLIARTLQSPHPERLADEVSAFRQGFTQLHFVNL